MNRMTAVLVLFASVLLSQSASASVVRLDPLSVDFGKVLHATTGSVIVPTDWDGLWNTIDSVYVCGGVLQVVSAQEDTICGGQAFSEEPPASPFTFNCKGTATSTTIDGTCTGGGEIVTDCNISIVIDFHTTRTGETYRSVATINSSYSGTAEGCNDIPASCTRVVTEATRTGPAPVKFCTTPVKRTSWGRLKTIYR